MSLSQQEDDFLMWNVYADKATGVCIEFDEDQLEEQLRKLKINSVDLRHVQYQYASSKHYEILFNYIEKGNFEKHMGIKNCISNMFFSGYNYKKKPFINENEVRLVLSPFNEILPEFECEKNIRTYIKVPLTYGFLSKVIKSIKLGKYCQQSLPSLKMFLKSFNLEIDVKTSIVNPTQI